MYCIYIQHPLIDSISHHSSPLLSRSHTRSFSPPVPLPPSSPKSFWSFPLLTWGETTVFTTAFCGKVWWGYWMYEPLLSGAHRSAELVARLNLPRRTFIVLVNATSQGVWLRGRDSMCSTFVSWGHPRSCEFCLIKKGIGLGECSYSFLSVKHMWLFPPGFSFLLFYSADWLPTAHVCQN